MSGMCAAAQKIIPPSPAGQPGDTPGADPDRDNRSQAREDVGMDRRLYSLEIDVATLKETVATKTAISELKSDTKAAISELRAELRAEMGSLRTELKSDMGHLRAELHRELNAQTWKMIGACTVLVAATWVAGHSNYVAVPAVAAAAAVPAAAPSPPPASALR
jgi:hypothetical protein